MTTVKLCLISLILTLFAGRTLAQQTVQYSAEHLAAAERVVYAMGLPERFIIPTRILLERSREKDPARAPLMDAVFKPYLERKYTGERLKGFFASHFDLDTCKQVAVFWEGPVGKKIVQNQKQMLATGEMPELVFTAREKALIKKFDATRAAKTFQDAMPLIEDLMAEYTKDTQMKMREKFLQELKIAVEKEGKTVQQ